MPWLCSRGGLPDSFFDDAHGCSRLGKREINCAAQKNGRSPGTCCASAGCLAAAAASNADHRHGSQRRDVEDLADVARAAHGLVEQLRHHDSRHSRRSSPAPRDREDREPLRLCRLHRHGRRRLDPELVGGAAGDRRLADFGIHLPLAAAPRTSRGRSPGRGSPSDTRARLPAPRSCGLPAGSVFVRNSSARACSAPSCVSVALSWVCSCTAIGESDAIAPIGGLARGDARLQRLDVALDALHVRMIFAVSLARLAPGSSAASAPAPQRHAGGRAAGAQSCRSAAAARSGPDGFRRRSRACAVLVLERLHAGRFPDRPRAPAAAARSGTRARDAAPASASRRSGSRSRCDP